MYVLDTGVISNLHKNYEVPIEFRLPAGRSYAAFDC